MSLYYSILNKNNLFQASHSLPDWSARVFPRTLAEFMSWWLGLGKGYAVYEPVGVHPTWSSSLGRASQQPSPPGSKHVRLDLRLETTYGAPPERIRDASVNPREIVYVGAVTLADKDLNEMKIKDKEIRISIPITTFDKYTVLQDSMSAAYEKWHHGDFQAIFPDLTVASRDKMDLPLEDVKEFLHDEAGRGTEVLKLLG